MVNGVLMPKAGITVESCIIGKWRKAVGDRVAVGEDRKSTRLNSSHR